MDRDLGAATRALRDHRATIDAVERDLIPAIAEAASRLSRVLRGGAKILAFGNGGSAADAQHFAAELVGRYKRERAAWPAIALTTDTSALTAIGNDYGFDEVFARQVRGLAARGDAVVALSTSGTSRNVLRALEAASEAGAYRIALGGRDGGPMRSACELPIIVPSDDTARIQEAHITILHIVCELIEEELSSGAR